MNKGELIYLKMSNGNRVFLNINEIVVVLANRITMDNSDDDDISTETSGTKLEFCLKINLAMNTPLPIEILMV